MHIYSLGGLSEVLCGSQVLNHKGGFSPIADQCRVACEVLWFTRNLDLGPQTSLFQIQTLSNVGPLTSVCFLHLQNNAYLPGLF